MGGRQYDLHSIYPRLPLSLLTGAGGGLICVGIPQLQDKWDLERTSFMLILYPCQHTRLHASTSSHFHDKRVTNRLATTTPTHETSTASDCDAETAIARRAWPATASLQC